MSWLKSLIAGLILRREARGAGPVRASLELGVAVTLWFYLFSLIVTLVVGRSVGSALFLWRFDGQGLALVYIMVGAAVAGLVWSLGRLGRRFGAQPVAFCTLLAMGVFALGAAFILPRLGAGENGILYGLVYLLVESFAFVTTVQFWSIANSTLSLEQATRLYVFIGTGGIFGSIVGGTLTRMLAQQGASSAFLLVACVVPVQLLAIGVFSLLARRLDRYSPKQPGRWNLDHTASSIGLTVGPKPRRHLDSVTPPDRADSVSANDSLRSGRRPFLTAPSADAFAQSESSLAIRMGVVSLLMVFATTLVDFYFKMFADRRFSGNVHELTSFFGGFYLCVGLTTLASQTLITPIVLRWRTAFLGLITSPIALTFGAVLNWFWPGLWAAATLKLADSVLSHSVYRSCQEMLYTPLPTQWVLRLKSVSDGVMGRYGLLLAGLALALVSPFLESHGPQWLLPLTLAATLAWALAIARLKREYRRRARSDAIADHVPRTPDDADLSRGDVDALMASDGEPISMDREAG